MRTAALGNMNGAAISELELELEQAAERMDGGALQDAWTSLPPEIKQEIQRRAVLMWQMRGGYLARFLTVLNGLFAQNPAGWQQALMRNRAATAQQMARLAGQMAQLPVRGATPPPGMSPVQVRQYHRRQQARGRVPGRNRQTRHRELELEIDIAARELELEQPEPFYTRVTPIPGIGSKEGHEIITRDAMVGIVPAADQKYVREGVIRPDRGGQSYWNFPRAALDALKARNQPLHALRPTPAFSVAAALRLIRLRFAGLHARAMARVMRGTRPDREEALRWLGEALHLLQDSFSSAHVERAGGTGRIRHIRVFFIRFGLPPLSRAPAEHNAPSDPRDDVYLRGALRPEARAAVRASQAFLKMAMRHLRSPRSPANVRELRLFMNRYLSM